MESKEFKHSTLQWAESLGLGWFCKCEDGTNLLCVFGEPMDTTVASGWLDDEGNPDPHFGEKIVVCPACTRYHDVPDFLETREFYNKGARKQ